MKKTNGKPLELNEERLPVLRLALHNAKHGIGIPEERIRIINEMLEEIG